MYLSVWHYSWCVATSDTSGRFHTPNKSGRGTLESMTPGSGGSLKIGRRSRSKSPFRSFRWKRSTSQAIDGDEQEPEGIFSEEADGDHL